MKCPCLLLVLTLATISRTGWAREHARLELSRAPAAAACPDAERMTAMVAERLGADPFKRDAASAIRITFGRDESVLEDLVADIALVNAHDEPQGRRSLRSKDVTCTELANNVVLTVTLLLESLALPVSAPERPAKRPQEPVTAPEPELRSTSDTAQGSWSWQPSLGVVLGVASSPSPSVGFALGLLLRRAGWSLGLEGRIDLPSEEAYALGSIRTQLRVGHALGCGHVGPGFACGLLGVGALSADGISVTNPRHTVALYAHVGARVGASLPLAKFLHVYGHIDVLAPLTRTTIGFGATDVWTTPSLAGALGVGLLGRFP